MHPLLQPRALGRWSPLAAAIMSSAVIAAPANAAAPVGGPVLPAIAITYNTGEILYTDPPGNPTVATVSRGAAPLATGTFNAPDPAAPGEFGVNSFHLALAGTATGCWDQFVPQILPGDSVTVDGTTVAVPDITANPPQQVGNTVVVTGTATGVDPSVLDVEIAPAGAGRFAGGVGAAGGQFLSSLVPRGFAAVFNMTDATHWKTTFSGLDAGTLAIAAGGTASVMWDPAALAAVDPPIATTVAYEAGSTGAAVPGCAGLFRPNEATGADRALINMANVGNDLTVNGVSQPGASASQVMLIDSNNKTVSAGAFGLGNWSGTIPASSLSGLADGAIRIASVYSIGAGRTVSGLLRKDTTAPAAPTSSLTAGSYTSAQNAELSAAEGTIYYTTDGSAPSTSSTKYASAIKVAATQTIKAIAVDGAGNASPVSSFDYAINKPVVQQPIQVVAPSAPKMRLDALTLTSRMKLRTAKRRGIHAVVFAPEGAKVIKVRLLYRNHVITRTVKVVRGDGVITLTLPSTRKGRAKLRRGTYKLQVTPGASTHKYGATTTRTIRIS
jgi:Chitobiase/beta-hexosaminidase C-terminal domain